jgi:hypothetical protein
VGSVIVNMARQPELAPADLDAASRGELDAATIEVALKEAGVRADDTAVAGLMLLGCQHAERVALEAEQRVQLEKTGRPVVTLPYLADGVDLGGLYDLAEELCESGF